MDEMTRAVLDQESGSGWVGNYHSQTWFADDAWNSLTHPFVSEMALGRAMLDSWDGPGNYVAYGNNQPPNQYNDFNNDNFEMPFRELLRPTFMSPRARDFTMYFNYLQNWINNDCSKRTRLRDVWHYNFNSTDNATVFSADLKILNTDRLSEWRYIVTPTYAEGHQNQAQDLPNGSIGWHYEVDVRNFDSPSECYNLTHYREDAYNSVGQQLPPIFVNGGYLSDDIILSNGTQFYIHGSPSLPDWYNRSLAVNVTRTINNGHFLASTCGRMTIQVNAGTRLELGSVSPYRTTEFEVESGGTINVSGGTLVVNPGSTLRMRPGSTLIIAGITNVYGLGNVIVEPGARLEIRPGAQLALHDKDSRLTLQGEFVIAANTTFQPTGNGYVYFDLPDWTPANGGGDNNLGITDGTSRFILSGSNPMQRIAVVAPDSHITPTYWGDFQFTIENGTVEMGANASISAAASTVRLVNARFEKQPAAAGGRYGSVVVFGCGRETIQNSEFIGGDIGLSAVLDFCNGVAGWFENLSFQDCRIGLKTVGKGATLVNCTFLGNSQDTEVGWQMEAAQFPQSTLKGCTISGYHSAVDFVGGAGVNLLLDGPQLHHNMRGLVFSSLGTLQAHCGAIYDNKGYGLTINGGTLDLSQKKGFSISRNGAPGLSASIELNSTTGLLLDNGNNNIIGRDPTTSGIRGSVVVPIRIPSNYTYTLPAAGNYWNVNSRPPVSTNWLDVQLIAIARGSLAPVNLLDNQPAGPTLCNVDPCAVSLPNGAPAIPCWLNEKLAHCPTCEPVSSSFAATDSLHLLVRQVIAGERKYDSINGNDLAAMEKLAELLQHPLADTTADEQRILKEAYRELLNLYAGLTKDSTQMTWSHHQLLTSIMDQQILRADADTALTNPEFYLRLDKTLAAYAAGDLLGAQEALAAAAPLNTPLTQSTYDYWQCFLDKTQRFRDSSLSVMEYLHAIETCHVPQAAGRGAHRQTAAEYLAEQYGKQKAQLTARQTKLDELTRLRLAPNPASTTVTVTFADTYAGSVTLSLCNMTGQTVRHWQRMATAEQPNEWVLDLRNLPPGIYLFRIKTAARTETRRLVVE